MSAIAEENGWRKSTFARIVGAVGAAVALTVALVSSVEYVPPTGQNWRPVASSTVCRCAPVGAPDYICNGKTCQW